MNGSILDKQLCRLIYASVAKADVDFAVLKSILEVSDKNNSRDDITGALMFADGFFLQILEGSRKKLSETYRKISNDDRHSQLHLIEFTECSQRQFDSWALRHLGFQRELLEISTGKPEFDPQSWSANQCNDFFLKYSMLLVQQELEAVS